MTISFALSTLFINLDDAFNYAITTDKCVFWGLPVTADWFGTDYRVLRRKAAKRTSYNK